MVATTHVITDTSDTCPLLQDLPIISQDAFKNFNGTCGPEVFREYLSLQEDVGPDVITIKTDPTPNLIRILFGRVNAQNKRKHSGEKDNTIPKRARWNDMDRDRKQSCLRVAIIAAAKYAQPGDCVYKLHQTWAQNPKKRQTIDTEVRSALCSQIRMWSMNELKEYLIRAGIPGSNQMSKSELTRVIKEHMGVVTD